METTKDNFNFFLPIEMLKGKDKENKDSKYDNMIIQGIASDNSEDYDEEILEPNGFILDRFLKAGILNLEHSGKTDPSNYIGEPVEAHVKDNKFYVKAKLWKDQQKARSFWDTVEAMEKSGSTRRPGFSIEGKALERDPHNQKRIRKALITGLAVTFTPKNYNTFASIVKGNYENDFIEPEFDYTANGGIQYIIDIQKEDGTRITVDKDFNIKIDKAMSTVTGKPLMKESLGEKLYKLQPEFIKIKNNKHLLGDDIIKRVKDNIKNLM